MAGDPAQGAVRRGDDAGARRARTPTGGSTTRSWTRQLPARSVVNVSLDRWVWSYLGDHQVKLTRTFRPERWLAEAPAPGRDETTRQAIAEALAIVSYGRSRAGRQALARAADGASRRWPSPGCARW